MAKRGRKETPFGVSLTLYLLVELDRDRRTGCGRHTVNAAVKRISDRWNKMGKIIPEETIRRHYKLAKAALGEAGIIQADAGALATARAYRAEHGWPNESLILLGFRPDGIYATFAALN
jgi:hypothetical protein